MRHVDLRLAVGRERQSCRRLLYFVRRARRVFFLGGAGPLEGNSDITVISEMLAVVLSQSDVQGSRATLSEERRTLQIQTKSESVFVDSGYLMPLKLYFNLKVQCVKFALICDFI